MELEFDKEIDVLLRKTRDDRGVLVGDSPPEPKKHLDADAVAAFVENALPSATRMLYMEHFADCDRCRKILSNGIAMNPTAASMAAVGAAEAIAAPIGDATPWYSKLLRTPNLALAMGALVLVFSGVLGFLVFQNRNAENAATVSQVTEPEMQKGGPYAQEEGIAANSANTLTQATADADVAPTPAEAPDIMDTRTQSANKPVAGLRSETDASKADAFGDKTGEDKKMMLDGSSSSAPSPKNAAPPPAPTDDRQRAGSVAGAISEVQEKESKDEDTTLAKRKAAESRRDLPASPAKAGPTRGAGPVQNQSNQVNNNIFDMVVTRVVSGKTFENRDGAWYDRAYKNQKTNNYRRGTDEYRKLERGLRSIADNLGGTVVMMWKDKAYRIN